MAMVVLLCLMSLVFMWRSNLTLHPAPVIGVILAVYLLIGGANLSYYRGIISEDTVRFIFLNIAMMIFGSSLSSTMGSQRRQTVDPDLTDIPMFYVIIAACPGVLGVLWILATVGAPILNPSLRFGCPPAALQLIDITSAAFALQAIRMVFMRKPGWLEFALLLGLFIILNFAGYRNIGLKAFAIGIFTWHITGRYRLTPARALFVAGVGMAVLSGLGIFRRATSTQLSSIDRAMAFVHASPYLPSSIAEIHFAVRESIGITQTLIMKYGAGSISGIFFGDLITLLPGKQVSGGGVVAQLMGGALQAGGLTPGLSGAAYIEFGIFGLSIPFAIGLLNGYAWRRAVVNRSIIWITLYSFILIYSVNIFHRGIFAPQYLFSPLYFVALIGFWKLVKPIMSSAPVRRTGFGGLT